MAIRSFFLVVRQDLLKSVLTIRTRIRYLLELIVDFYLVFKKICRQDQFLEIVMFHLFHPIIANYHGMREISWHILIILIIRKWPTKYFKDKQLVNFDIIHHECCGDKLQNSYKHYKTVKEEDFKNYPDEKKKKLFLVCLET